MDNPGKRKDDWLSPPLTIGGKCLVVLGAVMFAVAYILWLHYCPLGPDGATEQILSWLIAICGTILFAAGFLCRKIRER